MNFHLEQRDIPFVAYPGIGLMDIPHLHKHIEIVLIESGQVLAVADSKEVTLNPGDLFIAFPNQVHYYIDKPSLSVHKILILSPDICPEFYQEFKNYLPVSPVLRAANKNQRILFSIENMIECYASKDKYSEAKMKGHMLILLGELLTIMPMEENPAYDTNLLTGIINYCYDNYTEDISLQSLSDTLHVSHFYISHLFSKRLHVSFRDYINSLRIGKACELIKTNRQTITEIAYSVGYNSTRTFNRCFLKVVGLSPKEYREKNINKKTRQTKYS